VDIPQCDRRRTNERASWLGVEGMSGCQRKKQFGALNSRSRPHIYFWNVSSNELVWLGPFSQRGQSSKPTANCCFPRLTINDTCLGADAALRRAYKHGVPWEPDVFRSYPHPQRALTFWAMAISLTAKASGRASSTATVFRDSSVGSASALSYDTDPVVCLRLRTNLYGHRPSQSAFESPVAPA